MGASDLKPFLKWAGGKRWIARHLTSLLGSVNSYAEPFLGSGTVFFALQPETAMLSDKNCELVNAFQAVRDNHEAIIACLRYLPIDCNSFMAIRSLTFPDPICRAARFIYLNRTAFNGLYRVNKQGKFNVPFGCKPGTKACDEDQLAACSQALQGASIRESDFREAIKAAETCEFIFLDPPYTVKHNNNCFRRYNEQLFAWHDQVDLAALANKLSADGNKLIITNAWHKEIASLYSRKYYRAIRLSRPSNMASSAAYRGRYEELLLISRTIKQNHIDTPTHPISAVIQVHDSQLGA